MFPAAHIASAVVLNRLAYRDDGFLPSALGALVPDAVDKTLAWVLRLTSSSHALAHNPLAAAALSAAVARWWGRGAARSFGTAYLAHLLGDEVHHGHVPWRFPLSRATRRGQGGGRGLLVIGLLLEIPALLLLLRLVRSGRAG